MRFCRDGKKHWDRSSVRGKFTCIITCDSSMELGRRRQGCGDKVVSTKKKHLKKCSEKIVFFLNLPNSSKNIKKVIFEIFEILKILRCLIRDFEILKMTLSTSSDNCFINLEKSVHSKPYTFLKVHNHPDTFLKSWENRM